MDTIKLQDNKIYTYNDMVIETEIHDDFCPVLRITTRYGQVIIRPMNMNDIIVKSSFDEK